MSQRTITVPCRTGLHLRAASRFVQFVRRFKSEIRASKGKVTVDAKSILGLLVLGAGWRTQVRFEVRGDDASQVIEAIQAYFDAREACVDEASPLGR